jgi:hypothetical protein
MEDHVHDEETSRTHPCDAVIEGKTHHRYRTGVSTFTSAAERLGRSEIADRIPGSNGRILYDRVEIVVVKYALNCSGMCHEHEDD